MPIKRPNPVPPRAYTLSNTPLPFSRGTFYRWEKLGLITLLRVGSKTLISADTVEAILAGRIALPRNAGMVNPPTPYGRKREKPRPEQRTTSPAE
jgi:hypothetical protein